MQNRNNYFEKEHITNLEMICMALILSFFFLSLIAGMHYLESFTLLIGITIGVYSLYKITVIAKEDPDNNDELNAWSWRFAVFKGVPLIIALVAVFV